MSFQVQEAIDSQTNEKTKTASNSAEDSIEQYSVDAPLAQPPDMPIVIDERAIFDILGVSAISLLVLVNINGVNVIKFCGTC